MTSEEIFKSNEVNVTNKFSTSESTDESASETGPSQLDNDDVHSNDEESSSSDTELNPNSSQLDADIEGISLLKEIFPDESINNLRDLHFNRVQKQRFHIQQQENEGNVMINNTNRSERNESAHRKWNEMESKALREHVASTDCINQELFQYFTVLIHRDPRIGLGMTLRELPDGNIQVCKLKSFPSPSANAGIRLQDILIGINGNAVSTIHCGDGRMNQIVQDIQESPNPIVLHFQRQNNAHSKSLLDSTSQKDFEYLTSTQQIAATESSKRDSNIHPFAKVLHERGLIHSLKDQFSISNKLKQFADRASWWESQIFMHSENIMSSTSTSQSSTTAQDNNIIQQRLIAPSTPFTTAQDASFSFSQRDHLSHLTDDERDNVSNASKEKDVFPSLTGLRTALSTRILNYFVEEDSRTAYTIWVCDIESGKEWYAPIRYWEDFCDLRNATLALTQHDSHVADFAFPMTKPSWTTLTRRGDFRSTNTQQDRCSHLEKFLRGLCGLVFSAPSINFNVAKIAMHLESFLGTELGLSETNTRDCIDRPVPPIDFNSWKIRWLLKRSIQRYTWRLFQLEIMRALVDNFVDMIRAKAPKLEEMEGLEGQGRLSLKQQAMNDMESIRQFLNQMVDLILESEVRDEIYLISQHADYAPIQHSVTDDTWDSLVREAVREQVEIEVYVPLRSVVSRLLVNGWRYEDTEIQLKIKELQKRSQEHDVFRIPDCSISPSNWQSVAGILRQGVGNNTLPCAKLRAIVDAAREISELHIQEHNGKDLSGGADDFLPVFIFCVVQANLERPCALCVLLCTLVDQMNSIGEIGYFLASFEAVITHLQEIDLTEHPEKSLSYLTVPFSEVSLND